MFDLDKSIAAWLRQFRKHKAFDYGSVQEIEQHVRDYVEELVAQGHSEESAFKKAIEEFGSIPPVAKEEYWSQRPKTGKNSIINTTMLKNYFKIATRNFVKHKFYTLVNVFGLTLGLAIVFLIGLFVNDELSFDRFHTNENLLYRVVENQHYDGQPVFPVAVTPFALAPSLQQEYPDIVRATRANYGNYRFKKGERAINEDRALLVDEEFFEMFTYPVISGSLEGFKEKLNALVLTEELAEKYFPGENAAGKLLELNNEQFEIVAVIQDVPKNSHLPFRYLLNFERLFSNNPDRRTNWSSNSVYTYVQLHPSADMEEMNGKIIDHIKRNLDSNTNSVTDIYLQPLSDIYLGSVDFVVEAPRKGERMYVNIFSIVAIFILLISCINFMNLSTARSAKRAKEVGLRKTIGAKRGQLIFQFLSESVLLSLMAVLLAIGIVLLLLPSFNQISGKEFSLTELVESELVLQMVLGVLVVAIGTGLLAGSYPALFLSSIKPVNTLKTESVSIKQGVGLRKVLVVFQFVISLVLIIGTMVIYQQLQYIQDVDLGYSKENIVYTNVPGDKSRLFANEMRNRASVVNVGISNRHPAYILSSSSGFNWPGKNMDETYLMHYMSVDENYLNTMEIEILEGRDILPADSAVVLINQKALEVMKLEDPVGKTLDAGGPYKIIGVVKDFNFKSIHTAIEPILIFKQENLNMVYIKYENGQESDVVAGLEDVWNEIIPDQDLQYTFLQTDFDELYNAEKRTRRLSTYFTILAVVISCLGLFGLVSYAMEQKMKEVGIRKVLGASVKSLFLLLTTDFTKLVLVAIVLAVPLGWYAMNEWLNSFAYRTNISWWIFLLAGVAAMFITMVTVSYQSIRVSRSNPVSSLRNE